MKTSGYPFDSADARLRHLVGRALSCAEAPASAKRRPARNGHG